MLDRGEIKTAEHEALTLGDFVGSAGNPAVDALFDKMLGRKREPAKVLVADGNGDFSFARLAQNGLH